MTFRYKGQSISGPPGKDATINGQNILEIVAGENVTIEQQNNVLTINADGGGSAGDVYSLEETRIGTWIDGKPLYRKLFFGTLSSSETTNIGDPIENLEELVYLFGMLRGANGYWTPLTFFSGGEPCLVQVSISSNIVTAYNKVAPFRNSPIKVEAVYTKTTDVAASEKANSEVDIPATMSIDDVNYNMFFAPSTTSSPYASVTSSATEAVSIDVKKENDV